MKAFLLTFLLFTSFSLFAAPSKVISEVCDYDYVQGVTLKSMNGSVYRVCLLRRNLPDTYLTDSENFCAFTHEEIYVNHSVKRCIIASEYEEEDSHFYVSN